MEEGKMSLKTKLLLGGIGGSLVTTILFIVVMIAPLMILGIIKIDGIGKYNIGGGLSFSKISSSGGYWWPIGSSETEEKNGKIYASGTPVSSKSDDYPDGISSYFGTREAPIEGATTNHGAIDIPVPVGTNVIAPLSGTISYVNTDPSANKCGIYIKMIDSKNNELLFCHLSDVKVNVDEEVDQGQVIALSGNTGNSSGPHLHFGMTVNGIAVDPQSYVDIDNPRPKAPSSSINFVSGNDVAQTVCKTLKNSGYTDITVAAIMGNMQRESSFNPSVVNFLGCHGLIQWCFGRKDNLVAAYGADWVSVENQLNFMFHEFETSEANNIKYLNTNIDLDTMTHHFCRQFERADTAPDDCQDYNGHRQTYARDLLPYVQNGCE